MPGSILDDPHATEPYKRFTAAQQAELSQAIVEKLRSLLGGYGELSVLAEYMAVMLQSSRPPKQIGTELEAFLQENSVVFTEWLCHEIAAEAAAGSRRRKNERSPGKRRKAGRKHDAEAAAPSPGRRRRRREGRPERVWSAAGSEPRRPSKEDDPRAPAAALKPSTRNRERKRERSADATGANPSTGACYDLTNRRDSSRAEGVGGGDIDEDGPARGRGVEGGRAARNMRHRGDAGGGRDSRDGKDGGRDGREQAEEGRPGGAATASSAHQWPGDGSRGTAAGGGSHGSQPPVIHVPGASDAETPCLRSRTPSRSRGRAHPRRQHCRSGSPAHSRDRPQRRYSRGGGSQDSWSPRPSYHHQNYPQRGQHHDDRSEAVPPPGSGGKMAILTPKVQLTPAHGAQLTPQVKAGAVAVEDRWAYHPHGGKPAHLTPAPTAAAAESPPFDRPPGDFREQPAPMAAHHGAPAHMGHGHPPMQSHPGSLSPPHYAARPLAAPTLPPDAHAGHLHYPAHPGHPSYSSYPGYPTYPGYPGYPSYPVPASHQQPTGRHSSLPKKWRVARPTMVRTTEQEDSSEVQELREGEIVEQVEPKTTLRNGVVRVLVRHPSSPVFPAPIGWVTLDSSSAGGHVFLEPGPEPMPGSWSRRQAPYTAPHAPHGQSAAPHAPQAAPAPRDSAQGAGGAGGGGGSAPRGAQDAAASGSHGKNGTAPAAATEVDGSAAGPPAAPANAAMMWCSPGYGGVYPDLTWTRAKGGAAPAGPAP